MKALKLTALAIVVVSQVFFVRYVIVPNFAAARVSPGQVWEYRTSLPFHEKDLPQRRTVIAVKDGRVQYTIPAPELPGGVFIWDCPRRIFIINSKRVD